MYCYDEVMNTWKSYMGSAEWRIKWRMIIAVIYVTFAVAKRKPEKQFRFVRDSNHWPLRYRCSALPIKLTNQLGAGSLIGSLCFDEGTLNYQFAKAITVHWLEIIDRMLRLSLKKMRTVLKKKKMQMAHFLKKNYFQSRHDPKSLFTLKDSWQQTCLCYYFATGNGIWSKRCMGLGPFQLNNRLAWENGNCKSSPHP